MIILNCFLKLKYFRTANRLFSISFLVVYAFLFTSCEKYPCPPDPTITSTDPIVTDPVVTTIVLQGSGVSRTAMLEGFASERTTNYGSSDLILAGEYGSAGLQERSLLDFDYSSIPSNAIIEKATLTLYANITSPAHLFYGNQGHYSDPSPATNAWLLFRVLSDWDQSTVTWDTSPSFDVVNQVSLPASTSFDQTYTVEVTTLVADQIKNPSSYYGFMMISQNEDLFAPAYVSFCSGVYSDSERRPKMEIDYQLP